MIHSIEKAKIPREYGYPLRSSRLEELLSENHIKTHVDLIYRFHKQCAGELFDVFFWLPNKNVPYERLYIRTDAFPMDEVYAARAQLENAVFPRFIKWVKPIIEAQPNSTLKKHNERFYASFHNHQLTIRS